MAAERRTSQATRPGELVHLPRQAPERPALPDPRESDVDEWGRSEHMRELARRLYEPIYSRWFRAEWEGLDKIPVEGGALIIANHAAAIPSDAPVIMHGIEKELGRPVYGLADHLFKALPLIGTMWARVGGVAAHPENAFRLLREQQQLVLAFPEGSKGPGKLYRERYQLRRFGRGGFVEIAMRAGVPIVPIAVMGAEESMPIVYKSSALAKVLNLPYFPVTANHLLLGPVLGTLGYFPAKFKLRVLDPVSFDVPPEQERYSKSRIMEEGEKIRLALQEAVHDMLRHRRSVWFGVAVVGRRVLITGLSTFWGSRVALALESRPDVDVIVGLDTSEPTVPLERTEFVRADQSYSILARIVRATQVDTILHTFLVVDSTRMSGRALHEVNVIGTMNLLAAAGAAESSVRTLVVKSSTLVYGSSFQDPVWFREEMTRNQPATTRVERSLLEVEGYLRDFADDNPHVCVSLLRFANVLGWHIVTPLSKALSMPAVPSILGFDPLLQFVEEDDVVRSIEYVMRSELPGIFNVAGDGRIPWSEVAAICGKRVVPVLPPVLTQLAAGPLARSRVLDLPPELLALLRYGRGVDNRRLKQAGFEYRFTSAGAIESFVQGSRLHSTLGKGSNYRYERDVETFFRHSPAVVRSPE